MKSSDIETLPRTTFSGRRFTRRQLEQVKETVFLFKNLSRKELAETLCEHLTWKTPSGKNKVNSCIDMLEELEEHGIVELPLCREAKKPSKSKPKVKVSRPITDIEQTLKDISPITLQMVETKKDREEWKAYLENYHYLGYRHPVGEHIGYFIVSKKLNQKIGCMLFSASAAWALEDRDKWIGWEDKHRKKLLQFVLSNNRYLIFPWVKVPHLASHALSLATKQIANDWLSKFCYKPVLIETYVDPTKYSGTCYVAANWHHIGKTKGRGRFDPKHEYKKTIKDIYAYPLDLNWRQVLTYNHTRSSLKKKYRNDIKSSNTREVEDSFIILWEKVAKIITNVASDYDNKWQLRKRVINSMLLVLFIFRLVLSKNSLSYGTVIDELWDSCKKLNLPLPQKESIAPSSLCTARKKLDENIFKSINKEILKTYQQEENSSLYTWRGHRLFAVDGSKINLPSTLIEKGYNPPTKHSNYPQGLLSCLYQLKSQLPFDFELANHYNERLCVIEHLKMVQEDDIIVYDRGYFSYDLLSHHTRRGIHAIFRLKKNSNKIIESFFSSKETDTIVSIYPFIKKTQQNANNKHSQLKLEPLTLRLIKYKINDTTFCLGTTLLDQNKYNNIKDFADIYHSRWGIEELYKVTKKVVMLEDIHAKTERGVKQEIYARFVILTMNRIFSNQTDIDLNNYSNNNIPEIHTRDKKTNFKNCINVFHHAMEGLIVLHNNLKNTVSRVYNFIVKRNQRKRPGRSYERKSMKPVTNWKPPKICKNKLPKQLAV